MSYLDIVQVVFLVVVFAVGVVSFVKAATSDDKKED